jgi:hypothetical protein
MRQLDPAHWNTLRSRLLPDRPGPLVGLHMIATGLGEWWVDRFPSPRAAMMFVGGNLAFFGQAAAVDPERLSELIERQLRSWDRVFIEASGSFETRVTAALGVLQVWPRVILGLEGGPSHTGRLWPGTILRRVESGDTAAVAALSEDIQWISDTVGGPAGLARSALAWGAFVDGQLASIAVPAFIGDTFEDIGVATEEKFRGRGLSPACAARVVEDLRQRGRRGSWSTTPANAASLRVAHKLGYRKQRDDFLLIAGKTIGPA